MNPIMFGRQPSALADGPASPSLVTELPRPHRRRDPDEKIAMPDIPDECWSRVKERLRAELGEAIYTSWFARMELESQDIDTVRISVPTRFLKSWIQSHYSEKFLTCWQAERPSVRRIDLSVRSAATRTAPPCPTAPADAPAEKQDPARNRTEIKSFAPPGSAAHDSHGGSPLD